MEIIAKLFRAHWINRRSKDRARTKGVPDVGRRKQSSGVVKPSSAPGK